MKLIVDSVILLVHTSTIPTTTENKTMNRLLTDIIEQRNGHYCHALEVTDVWDLQGTIEGVIEGYPDYTEEEYIDFFQSIELYCLEDSNEQEVYDFNFTTYIKDTI